MESNKGEKSLLPEQDSTKLLSVNSKLCVEPESHLQSLGFTINNGKARFKLDEDAPLYSNAPVTNFCAVDADDTLSFVVLGKDSLDTIQQSSLASYVDIQQKSMSIDYNSMIASWDSADLHQKLNELLQENTKLKETLKQNNTAMKQQFNTLATWQEEIMKVHQNHKKKFAETRELINYLKKENTELKMRLSSELASHTEMGYELLDANDEQEKTGTQRGSITTNTLTKSTFCELEAILNEETDKIIPKQMETPASTQELIQLEKKNVETERSLEEERIALNKEKENIKEERIAFNKEKENFEEEKKLLESRKKTLETEYKSLNDAKELLQQERISLQDEQTSLDQQSQLYEIHYKRTLELEKKKFEVKYDQLITELGILHESVQSKELRIQDLEKELAQHEKNANLLQTLLRLYEEDFKQERKLKESLLEEKNALNTDLQKQIEFNVQLHQEITRLKASGSQSSGPQLEPPLVSSLSCPKCDCTFRNVHSLESHIKYCLDLID